MSRRQLQRLVLSARQPSVLLTTPCRTRWRVMAVAQTAERCGRQHSRVLHPFRLTPNLRGPLLSIVPLLLVRPMFTGRLGAELSQRRWRLNVGAVRLEKRHGGPKRQLVPTVHGSVTAQAPERLRWATLCRLPLRYAYGQCRYQWKRTTYGLWFRTRAV